MPHTEIAAADLNSLRNANVYLHSSKSTFAIVVIKMTVDPIYL